MNIRHFKRRDLVLRFVKAVLSLPRETPISRYTVNQNPSYMNRETVVRHERAWATRTGSKVKVRQFFFRIRVPTSRCLDGALTMFASNFISNICGAIYITTSCVHTFVRLSPLSLSSTFFLCIGQYSWKQFLKHTNTPMRLLLVQKHCYRFVICVVRVECFAKWKSHLFESIHRANVSANRVTRTRH